MSTNSKVLKEIVNYVKPAQSNHSAGTKSTTSNSKKLFMKWHTDKHLYVSFVCKIKTFCTLIALNEPLPMHKGEKPNKCGDCGKCFAHSTSLLKN